MCSSSALGVHPQRCGGGRVGLGDDRHVALGGADHGDVELVVGDGLEVAGSTATPSLASALVSPSISRSMRILNSFSVGSWRIDSAPVSRCEHVERAVEAEPRVGLDGDREPHVELVVAQVVVRDARMGVDDLRRLPRVLGVDLGRDEHRGVAERARVVDRRDLADDALVEQALHAREHLRLGHLGGRATAA